jgi:hypothetical protein
MCNLRVVARLTPASICEGREQARFLDGQAAFDRGDIEETDPVRGVADNVGDRFLFGGERHGHAAPSAGQVVLDPGVTHFRFLWLADDHRGARFTVRRRRAGPPM